MKASSTERLVPVTMSKMNEVVRLTPRYSSIWPRMEMGQRVVLVLSVPLVVELLLVDDEGLPATADDALAAAALVDVAAATSVLLGDPTADAK